ncbi:MAG: virulence factor [Cellvibrionales bacterium]|nr:virulence factor [Cellvibrionales bacterium]
MFAIALDLDTNILQQSYTGPSWNNAYGDVKRVLLQYGFKRQQGSVYFGDSSVDAVRCVLAVQELTATFEWFEPAVNDIRMLRIEDNNDLMPAVEKAPHKTKANPNGG